MMVFEVQLAVLKTDRPLELVVVREEVAVSSLVAARMAALASSFPDEVVVGREFLGEVMVVVACLEVVVVVVVKNETSLAVACLLVKPGSSRVVVDVEEVVVVEPLLRSPWLLNHLRIGFRWALVVVEVVEEGEKCWNLILKTEISLQFRQSPEAVVLGWIWIVAVEEGEEEGQAVAAR